MEDFVPLLLTTDTRKKITVGADLVKFLQDPANSLQCDDIGVVIDGLVPWMTNSNFKVGVHAIIDRLIKIFLRGLLILRTMLKDDSMHTYLWKVR